MRFIIVYSLVVTLVCTVTAFTDDHSSKYIKPLAQDITNFFKDLHRKSLLIRTYSSEKSNEQNSHEQLLHSKRVKISPASINVKHFRKKIKRDAVDVPKSAYMSSIGSNTNQVHLFSTIFPDNHRRGLESSGSTSTLLIKHKDRHIMSSTANILTALTSSDDDDHGSHYSDLINTTATTEKTDLRPSKIHRNDLTRMRKFFLEDNSGINLRQKQFDLNNVRSSVIGNIEGAEHFDGSQDHAVAEATTVPSRDRNRVSTEYSQRLEFNKNFA